MTSTIASQRELGDEESEEKTDDVTPPDAGPADGLERRDSCRAGNLELKAVTESDARERSCPVRERGELAERFRRFAEVECRGVSPLYEHVASSIAADDELLALAAHASAEQPVPNLLLAAVHLLLLEGARDPLLEFYPDLTDPAAPPASAYPAFRAFCLAYAGPVRQLLATRRVQTNEVGRCTYLFPAFTLVAGLARDRPLLLIEIGTSAGLNLMWDRYGYRYGGDAVYGRRDSPVQLSCALRAQ